ncbi:MAG: PD-(D/E)XK nuclease family protein [Bdellovibrio sp.]|nr:PD-(D/E)XK nuclease family protein [Methylotenera sp.]
MQNCFILCPTARLVRAIQADIARAQLQSGCTQWQSAPVHTLAGWLDSMTEAAILAGNIAQPQTLLAPFNEQLLWEETITQSLKKNIFGDLFDVSGLANAAMEANKYMLAWHLHIPREHQAEESRQFLQWQRAFTQRCQQLNVLESVRYVDWQLDCLAQGKIQLAEHIAFAGFDQTAPQEQRLRTILITRGVQVSEYLTTSTKPAIAQHVSLDNIDAECRAAVAWAQQQLDENPNVKIAIVAPQLSEVRNQLADLLDDIFFPASLRPSLADVAKNYNFSLGTPLIQQPIIQAALNLLRLLTAYQLQQPDITTVLLSPFWSANQQEADARAMLDAKMRDKLPMQLSLARFVEFAQKQHDNGLSIEQLFAHLNAAMAISSNRAMPSQWALNLDSLLTALGWPGERSISSLEYQAISAWQKALQQLAKLDVLGKNLSPNEAVLRMQQICTAQVFQAETTFEPSIQIVGIMEALSTPIDALWCMQMNDHIWPPPARPNPLLPAFIQRAASVPGADNHIQAVFAANIHQRLIHSASHIIFSSSKTENESQLRASPLIKELATLTNTLLAATLAEQLSQLGNANLTQLEDHIAPPIQAGDHVSGGTGLLKAQAICPAWAFYQYRLGAKALKTPSNGLDNMDRGSLVHAVLERFWHPNEQFRHDEFRHDEFRHFADLRDMSVDDFTKAINIAIRRTLQDFEEKTNIASKTVLELEHERLYKLIAAWLQHEKELGVSFKIVDCEAEKKVYICGIEITLKIDRIQQFENGALAFIDYKTGQEPKMSSWDETRITEPQLPTYASFWAAFGADDAQINSQVSSVQFGLVKIADHAFIGVSTDNFETDSDKRKPKFLQAFTDWKSLLNHWKDSIEAIAQEIKMGEAAVKFNHENDLMYCEVLPLLRLPERQLQFERFQKVSGQKSHLKKSGVL